MPQTRTRVVIWEDNQGNRGALGPMDETLARTVRDEIEERGLKIHDELDLMEPRAWLIDEPVGDEAAKHAMAAMFDQREPLANGRRGLKADAIIVDDDTWNTPAELTTPTGPSILDAFKVLGERQVCDNRLTFAKPGSREASDAYANERQRRRSR